MVGHSAITCPNNVALDQRKRLDPLSTHGVSIQSQVEVSKSFRSLFRSYIALWLPHQLKPVSRQQHSSMQQAKPEKLTRP